MFIFNKRTLLAAEAGRGFCPWPLSRRGCQGALPLASSRPRLAGADTPGLLAGVPGQGAFIPGPVPGPSSSAVPVVRLRRAPEHPSIRYPVRGCFRHCVSPNGLFKAPCSAHFSRAAPDDDLRQRRWGHTVVRGGPSGGLYQHKTMFSDQENRVDVELL